MSFLDAQSRAILFEPPEAYEEALARYALSVEDIAFAKGHRRSHNRLGFAIQLALVRDLGRPLRAGDAPPQAIISVVADQLGIEPAVFGLYAQREETRREHAREIVAALGLRAVRADSDLKPATIPIKIRPSFRFEAGHDSNQLPAGFRP
jgi:TnpA family transposase